MTSAFLFTLAFVFVMPTGCVLLVQFVVWLTSNTNPYYNRWDGPAIQASLFQLGLAGVFLRWLHHKLASRSFPLNRVGG